MTTLTRYGAPQAPATRCRLWYGERRDGSRGRPIGCQRVAFAGDRLGRCSRSKLLSLVIGAIAKAISTPARPHDFDAGQFSIGGWLAVLLTFVLARVFAKGTLMREDLDGTV